jgi:hypothetical protein
MLLKVFENQGGENTANNNSMSTILNHMIEFDETRPIKRI